MVQKIEKPKFLYLQQGAKKLRTKKLFKNDIEYISIEEHNERMKNLASNICELGTYKSILYKCCREIGHDCKNIQGEWDFSKIVPWIIKHKENKSSNKFWKRLRVFK